MPSPHDDQPETRESDRRASYQNDPRYRAYYERLRRENEKRAEDQRRAYEEEVQPLTLDQLSEQEWDGTIKKISPTPLPKSDFQNSSGPSRTPRPATREVRPPATGEPVRPATQASPEIGTQLVSSTKSATGPKSLQDLTSGDIMTFDDGSLAIFKDAVSGKDYALFYFLEPTGVLSPRGIFLEQYEYKCIGRIPVHLFEAMKSQGRWDRDCVIFHLSEWDHVKLVPPQGGDSLIWSGTSSTGDAPGYGRQAVSPDQESKSGLTQRTRQPIRGQILKINVAGRVWESVFWGKDEMGSVVAHCTNKKWALMHLDLKRFEDSMELGELKPPSEIDQIQRELVDSEK